MPIIEQYIAGKHYFQNYRGRVFSNPSPGCWAFYQDKPKRSRARKPVGILPPKPYSFIERSSRPSYIRATREGADTVAHWGHYPVDELGEGRLLFPAGVENRLVTKALLKLKDQRVNLGVAMAEAQDTANMLGDISKRIANGYRRLAAKDPKGALAALSGVKTSRPSRGSPSRYRRQDIESSIPNRWLEYQYGINPLLSDLKGAWEELQKHEGWSWVTTVRATEVADDEMSTVINLWDQKVEALSTVQHRGYVSLSYRPQQYALQSIARLGMSNPFEIIWERTPFSFVLDYAWPMGDCLAALDATVGYEFLHGSYTTFSRFRTVHRPLYESSGSTLVDFSPGVGKVTQFDRKVYTTSPWPKPPRPVNPISLGRMANGLSLLASIFGGGRQR